jgi:hypothetical protein
MLGRPTLLAIAIGVMCVLLALSYMLGAVGMEAAARNLQQRIERQASGSPRAASPPPTAAVLLPAHDALETTRGEGEQWFSHELSMESVSRLGARSMTSTMPKRQGSTGRSALQARHKDLLGIIGGLNTLAKQVAGCCMSSAVLVCLGTWLYDSGQLAAGREFGNHMVGFPLLIANFFCLCHLSTPVREAAEALGRGERWQPDLLGWWVFQPLIPRTKVWPCLELEELPSELGCRVNHNP